LRAIAIALKTSWVALALSWWTSAYAVLGGTAGGAAPSGGPVVASAVLPSIEILPQQTGLAGTCGGAQFFVNTYIHVDTQTSADVTLSAPSLGKLIQEFTDNTGSLGSFNGVYPNYLIPANAGGLPPNTTVLLVIKTYTGQNLSGTVSYISSLSFNCTTGAVLNLVDDPPSNPVLIPTLSGVALAAMAAVLALLGTLAVRRRSIKR
jgi:hypothetical protein